MDVEVLEATENPEQTICMAARNDYYSGNVYTDGYETAMQSVDGDTLEDKKEHLICNTLLKHGHYGPLEHPSITFHVEGVSRVTMAQLTRHRHASFDVQSQRYVNMDPEPVVDAYLDADTLDEKIAAIEERFYIPPTFLEDQPRSKNFPISVEDRLDVFFHDVLKPAIETYNLWTDAGIPKEDARYMLPLATKVNMVFTVNARMLLHIADMRAAGDAQYEIRQLTNQVLDHAEDWIPTVMDYYNDEMKGRKNRLAP